MDVIERPSAEDLARAKADYDRAVVVLMADRDATHREQVQRVIGRCYRCLDTEVAGRASTVYVAVEGMSPLTGNASGWYFEQRANGEIGIKADDALQPGFLLEHGIEVEREEFVAAFNEVLTAVSRFVGRIPA